MKNLDRLKFLVDNKIFEIENKFEGLLVDSVREQTFIKIEGFHINSVFLDNDTSKIESINNRIRFLFYCLELSKECQEKNPMPVFETKLSSILFFFIQKLFKENLEIQNRDLIRIIGLFVREGKPLCSTLKKDTIRDVLFQLKRQFEFQPMTDEMIDTLQIIKKDLEDTIQSFKENNSPHTFYITDTEAQIKNIDLLIKNTHKIRKWRAIYNRLSSLKLDYWVKKK